MTRQWHDDHLFDSIIEAVKYEMLTKCGHQVTPHPAGHWGRDYDIRQPVIGAELPVMPAELKPIYTTSDAKRWENSHPATPDLFGPKPTLKVTDGDRCIRKAPFNPKTGLYEIAAISPGGCGSRVWVTQDGFIPLMVPCCPEKDWPPGAVLITDLVWLLRLYAQAKSIVARSPGQPKNQPSLFDEFDEAPETYKRQRPLDTGDKHKDEQEDSDDKGA